MNKKYQGGQAFVEFVIILPILFFLIIFGLQIFTAIYQAQVKQEEARAAFFDQMQYRANGGLTQLPQEVGETVSQPVRTEGLPIFKGDTESAPITSRVGICRELQGTCGAP